MNVKTKSTLILAAIGSALGLALSTPAMARDGHDHRNHHQHWQHQSHGHGHGHGRVIRERVVVQRPVYVDRYVTYAPLPAYPSYTPYVHYSPPVRHPGVVVSIDLPPLVFPLR